MNIIETKIEAGEISQGTIGGLDVLIVRDRAYIDHCTYRDVDAPEGSAWMHTTVSPEAY